MTFVDYIKVILAGILLSIMLLSIGIECGLIYFFKK